MQFFVVIGSVAIGLDLGVQIFHPQPHLFDQVFSSFNGFFDLPYGPPGFRNPPIRGTLMELLNERRFLRQSKSGRVRALLIDHDGGLDRSLR